MKSNLSIYDECFIASKQNKIRNNARKIKEIKQKINDLLEELDTITADIENDRYSIRKKIGRV